MTTPTKLSPQNVSSLSRRCDCESETCKAGHPLCDCTRAGTVKTLYSTICPECAKYMPAEYLKKEHPQFIFDGELTTLGAFLCENNQSLTLEEFLRVLAMQPGESVRFGGGAFAEQELRRVA